MPPEMPLPSSTSRQACHHTSRSSRTVDGDTVRPADYWPSRRWGTNGAGSTTDLGQNGVPILTSSIRYVPPPPALCPCALRVSPTRAITFLQHHRLTERAS